MILSILILLSGAYLGWNIGGNNAANCIGANIGCGRMKVREGIILTAIFCFLGAVLFGGNVITKIGKGIVPLDKILSGSIPGISVECGMFMILCAAISAGLCVMAATFLKIPASSSHAIVGAVAGTGVVFISRVPDLMNWSTLNAIFISWVTTPLSAAIIAFALYKPLAWILGKILPKKSEDKIIRCILFAASAALAFSWGANDLGNAVGVIAGMNIQLAGITITQEAAVVLGACAMALGILIFGERVVETVGFGITILLPIMAIVAEVASAANVLIYTSFGMPVSTSHSIVGAIAGVGMWHGIHHINKGTLRDIGLTCVGTPFLAGAVSFIMMKTLVLLGIARL